MCHGGKAKVEAKDGEIEAWKHLRKLFTQHASKANLIRKFIDHS